MKLFVWFIILVVTAAVVAGFFIVGSPAEQRLRRFDDRRVSDLQIIQSEITAYWQSKQKLPAKLVDLNDSLRGFAVPADPRTGADYEYEVRGPETFVLCGTFDRPSRGGSSKTVERAPVSSPGGYRELQYWEHSQGRVCFERKIDKDFFPKVSPKVD